MNNTENNTRGTSRLRAWILVGGTTAGLLITAIVWLNRVGEQAVPHLDNVQYMALDEYLLAEGNRFRRRDGSIQLGKVIFPIVPPAQPLPPPDSSGYVGPQECVECHREYYDSFIQTSHFHTSAIATPETVLGHFEPGRNELKSAHPRLTFRMLNQNERLVQRVLFTADGVTYSEDFPFDLVIGSGKVGQTYLYWNDQFLFQMHVSYLTSLDDWINSPGYIDGTADYARPTLAFCLECHTTHAQPVPRTINQYRRDSFNLGVTCERCHGPGEEHVAFHRQYPDMPAHGIVNPSNLPRQRALEVCQLCHGGLPESMLREPFHFRPGERLDEYYTFHYDAAPGGIHSNSQLPRLAQSKCFQRSESMTCIDCHNPHVFERGDFSLFSQRCQHCHSADSCKMHPSVDLTRLRENCIDCHMPAREMEDIIVMTGAEFRSPPMRDHFIRIAEEQTARVLQKWRNDDRPRQGTELP
ncbi:MAG: hypothetical protein KatS3mg111_1840 [Pirellulaceae bacterium]|nr:MAG: hypothetical protein KatS3mg111_1840 [Pirellulaceae bacterium]